MEGVTTLFAASDLSVALQFRLVPSVWLAATVLAWLLGIRGIAAAIWDSRRMVSALRWSTNAILADLIGLVIMVAVANPERWSTGAWCLSLVPVGVCLLAVGLAAVMEPAGVQT